MAAHNVGRQVPDPHRRARPMRKETMSGIWRSPELKPKVATQSPRKTTTSTPNIISGRCRPREQNSLWNARRRNASLTLSKMGIPLALRGRLLTQPYHANARCGRLSLLLTTLWISYPSQSKFPSQRTGACTPVRSCRRYRPNAERRPCLFDLGNAFRFLRHGPENELACPIVLC